MPFKNLLIKYEAQQKALTKALDALNSIARGYCSCPYETHPLVDTHKELCETGLAEEAIASIRKIVGK